MADMATSAISPGRRRVWSLPVRLLHWGLAASIVAAWCTTVWGVSWHAAFGWSVLACLGTRLAWGWVGPPPERMAALWNLCRRPMDVWMYARDMVRNSSTEMPPSGHNPMGACMVVALWLTALTTGLSGWVLSTDRYWGDEFWAFVHTTGAWGLVALVVLHVAGVLWTGQRRRVCWMRTMIDGVPEPQPRQDSRSTPSSSQA